MPLHTLDLLVVRTLELAQGSTLYLNVVDACDLCKLTPSMLVSRGCSERTAEKVSSALMCGDLTVLASQLGTRLAKQRWAPRLEA
jgi:hypothetical protein